MLNKSCPATLLLTATFTAMVNDSDIAIRLDRLKDFPLKYQNAAKAIHKVLLSKKEQPKSFYAEFQTTEDGHFLFHLWPESEWLRRSSKIIQDGSAGGRDIKVDGKTNKILEILYWQ